MPTHRGAPRGLPTREEFFQNRLIVNDKCAICHESFDAEHCPARINSRRCTHLFGVGCLRQWADSDNKMSHTCPVCREILFIRPKTPQFIDGARSIDLSNTWLHLIEDRVEAEKFVKSVWLHLWELFKYSAVFDSDIEEQINDALLQTAGHYDHIDGLYICTAQWPAVLTVGKEMVRSHYQNGVYLSCDQTLRTTWMPRMTEALGWDFERRQRERLNCVALMSAQRELDRAVVIREMEGRDSDEDMGEDSWDEEEEDGEV